MPSAVGLSLALHLAAFQLPDWSPAVQAQPTPAIQVRILPKPEPVPKPPIKPPSPQARHATTPSTPLLAGGGAMSDEMEEAVTQPMAAPAIAKLSQSASAAPMRTAAGLESRSAGGQGDGGEAGSARAGARAGPAVLGRAEAARAVGASRGGGTETGVGDGGNSGAVAASAPAARAGVLRNAAAQGAAGGAGRAAGVASVATDPASQRVDLAHAQTDKARLASAGTGARAASGRAQGAGAADSIPEGSLSHPGPVRTAHGLVTLAGATALDPAALNSSPSSFVLHATLAGDGEGCFRYTARMRRGHQQGLVVLRVRVNREGQSEHIEVRSGSGDAHLDAQAVEQARGCARFVVKNRKGQPVAASLDLPIRYRMTDE